MVFGFVVEPGLTVLFFRRGIFPVVICSGRILISCRLFSEIKMEKLKNDWRKYLLE